MAILKRLVRLVLIIPVLILDLLVWVITGRELLLTDILEDWTKT